MQLSIFILYLPYAQLTSYSTGLLQISNDVSYLWQMVRTRATEDVVPDIPEGSTGRGRGRGQALHGNPPPPPPSCAPVSIKQLLAMQNELMSMFI
jgi:hypothetical protein